MGLQISDPNIEKLMFRFGLKVLWYPARLCSCVGENNGNYLLNHTCNQGFYYSDPVETWLIKTQVSWKILNQPNGRIYNGGATFTIPKLYEDVEQRAWSEIAHGDIITIPTKFRRDTDILIRGTRDQLQAFDVNKILSVSRDDVVLTQNTDFELNDVTFTWLNDNTVKNGNSYTVEFMCSQQFKIWEPNSLDRGTQEDDLPKKINGIIRRYVNPDTNVLDDIELEQGIF